MRPRRPHNLGLMGPVCPEREKLDQTSRGKPNQAMCVQCGRATARRDDDGLAWCGGRKINVV